MSKKYCKCGKPNDSLANFCSGCGNKFVNLSSFANEGNKPKQMQFHSQRTYGEDNDNQNGDEDNVKIPDIKSLSVQIEDVQQAKTSIGSLMSLGNDSSALRMVDSIKNRKDPKIPKTEIKKIINEIRKEGQAIKPKQ